MVALFWGVVAGLEVEEWLEAQEGPDFVTVQWHQKSRSGVEFKFFYS